MPVARASRRSKFPRWSTYVLGASCLVWACGLDPERATYRLADRRTIVVVERRAIHEVLAEFERWAYLDVEGRTMARIDLFTDTGGYSRVNLYRLSDARLLMRDAEGSYMVDAAAGTITKDAIRRRTGTFVGCFDVDESKVWRFLPPTERQELPTEFRGG